MLLARPAGAGVVAADLGARPHEGRYGSVVVVVVMMVVVVMIVAAAACVAMGVIGGMMGVIVSRLGRPGLPGLRVGAHRLGPFQLVVRLI